ncbi:universal stress protein [Lentibacillus cibarius]|uniref:Universal stress protein n=1 Tax=Lentibacillus cibarius TaxID=2583219 RepID=A0A549YIR7_9BACI|nr:universal stress protein [Lentibacillus cibarius]TRM11773.1 universal stress protein [Lentibacillus cibarius]
MKRKILVAYDGSELSREALNEAKLQARGVPETEVYILSVVTQAGPSANVAVARSMEWELADNLKSELKEIEEEFQADDITVYTDVVIDVAQRNAGEKICTYAEEHDLNLIIIGSRGLGGVKRLLLGSVSTRVVQHAHCPVLVIK